MAGSAAEVEPPVLDPEEVTLLVQYDLTSRMAPFLDRHLIFPMFLFLRESGIYKKDDITRAEVALLVETNMIDFAIEKYESLDEDAPASWAAQRDDVMALLGSSRDKVLKLLEILEDDEAMRKRATFKSIDEFYQEFNLTVDDVDGLVHYAKVVYDCGNYSLSSDLCKQYRGIMALDSESLTKEHVSCTWGALASYLLNAEFDEAADVILKLDDYLENTKMSKQEVLLQRPWLLHWTLFAIFNPEKVEPKLLDFFLKEKTLSIISLACPHLFRYVGATLILHKRLKHLVKETVWLIHHEQASYSDPITRFLLALYTGDPVTRFLLALYTDMDFDEAQL
eukprot:CAMPEP_0170624960 /NCGR_PEP_ID=MMETSP0224-20130122/30510_1 /TAXON_ID=285029 /ORGANISM="Togula jolla, Strain CCCM 725" /LENGTH=337 /DNA_ID=CAMNT_0010951515 /DNA_START=24 /DNA_END=1033 /DNA_ORIENTATION=-